MEQLEDRLVPSNFTAANVSDLIADINAANRAGGANTITLTAPASTPYTLTAADNTTDGATGLPVIAANDNLTIIGNGDTIQRSTASGTPVFRLFDVAAGASLSLANLTLQGGLAYGSGVSAEGGALYNQGTLDLNGVTVQNNVAQGAVSSRTSQSAAGGGIYSAGALTLEGGTIVQNNLAVGGYGIPSVRYQGGAGGNGYGGGLYVSAGTATLTGVTLSSNTAQGGHGSNAEPIPVIDGGKGGNGCGGALFVSGGTVSLTNDTFSSNTAQGGQGGSYARTFGDPSVGISGGPGGNGLGGGVYAAGGTMTAREDTVTGNAALGGLGWAGGYRRIVPAPGVGEGGGLYMDTAATAYLDAYTVANVVNNTASTSDPNIHGSYKHLP